MRKYHVLLVVLAMLAGLSGDGWLAQRQQRNRLLVHLLEQQQALEAENAKTAVNVEGMVKSIEANVVKAQRQPKQVAMLDTCQALQRQTADLLDTLYQYQARALTQTGRPLTSQPMDFSGALDLLKQPFNAPTPADQALAQSFAAYRTLLPALSSDSLRVEAPKVDQQPILLVMAAIAQAGNDLLVAEQKLLRHFSRRVGASRLKKNLIAVASAEANVVRPGDTYRARLFVVRQLVLPRGATHMQCNSQPVATDQRGIGQVRFRAPLRLGSASWHGAIRFRINGRDTTFRVQIPYRVAQP